MTRKAAVHWAGFYLIVGAIISSAVLGKRSEGTLFAPKLVNVEVIPRHVNEKNYLGPPVNFPKDELARFSVTVFNPNSRPIELNTGEFLPKRLREITLHGSTMVLHQFHAPDDVSVWLNDAKKDSPIRFSVNAVLKAQETKKFTLWFKATDGPDNGVQLFEGTLCLGSECGKTNNETVTVAIHSDSQTAYDQSVWQAPLANAY